MESRAAHSHHEFPGVSPRGPASPLIFHVTVLPNQQAGLKGHSQLMHMRISYHFVAGLADLNITRHARETDSERRIRNI